MGSESGDDIRTSRDQPQEPWKPRAGQRVGRFTLREQLGAGGQGHAWLAADPHRSDAGSEGLVVLKFLAPDVRGDQLRLAEFKAAYVAAQALHHEAVCPLFDLGEDPTVGLFQVMLYQPGVTVRKLLQTAGQAGEGLAPATVLELLLPLARALDHVHSEQVVHADVKPENVIFDEYRRQVHLIDFGLAVKATYPRGRMPHQALAAGTERYRSPELWHGYRPDPADDRWALAVLAWELLSGEAPFAGSGWVLRDRVCEGELKTVRGMSPETRRVFEVAFAADQPARPLTSVEFFESLRRALAAGAGKGTVAPGRQAEQLNFPCERQQVALVQRRCAELLRLPRELEFPWGCLKLVPPGWARCGRVCTTAETLQTYSRFAPEQRIVDRELPARQWQLHRPLYFAATPVTVGQFAQFLEDTGHLVESERDGRGGWGFDAVLRKFVGPTSRYSWRETGWPQTAIHPVVNVSWRDAQAFAAACNRFSAAQPGLRLKFRLPTESEWEYACRAGSADDFWFGWDVDQLGLYGNVTDASKRRDWPHWSGLDSDSGFRFTSPVDHFKANPLGLFDLHGNVRQWCEDEATAAGHSRYAGQRCRVVRGGAWCNSPVHARCSARDCRPETHRDDHIGIRVVAEIAQQ